MQRIVQTTVLALTVGACGPDFLVDVNTADDPWVISWTNGEVARITVYEPSGDVFNCGPNEFGGFIAWEIACDGAEPPFGDPPEAANCIPSPIAWGSTPPGTTTVNGAQTPIEGRETCVLIDRVTPDGRYDFGFDLVGGD